MIIVDKADLKGTPRDAAGPGWTSLRLLVKSDGVGFSMTETHVAPGAELHLHYKHHIEAVYCLAGEGSITDVATGQVHAIHPGVLYALDQHDRHVVTNSGTEPLHFICVFTPALQGDEVHGPDGSYASG
jgi:L-ectoine synthase